MISDFLLSCSITDLEQTYRNTFSLIHNEKSDILLQYCLCKICFSSKRQIDCIYAQNIMASD